MPRRKNDEIRVHVVDYGRKTLYMRYLNPDTGKQVAKSTGTNSLREAERAAGAWEREVREQRERQQVADTRMTWDDFRIRYTKERLETLAPGTLARAETTFNRFEAYVSPNLLTQITASQLSRFQSEARDAKLAETSISTDLKNLGAALQWACDMEFIARVPKIPKLHRVRAKKTMKGRPLSDAEFQEMLKAVPEVLEFPEDKAAWQRYLNGLWLSGLRLEESLDFWWDRDDKLSVVLTGKYPMFRVQADGEKGNRDRLLPMTPDFAAMLLETPEDERVGVVFPIPRHRRRPGDVPSKTWVSRMVTLMGKAANVVVGKNKRTSKPKYASAHDLRRSFGTRWAPKVMPTVLQKLMRHENIETTMKFYVHLEAEMLAEALYEAARKNDSGNISGNAN